MRKGKSGASVHSALADWRRERATWPSRFTAPAPGADGPGGVLLRVALAVPLLALLVRGAG